MGDKSKTVRLELLAGLLALVLFVGYLVLFYGSARTLTIRVDEKERVGGDAGRYLVFAGDDEYQVSDSLLYMRFDASSRYNDLDEGGEYLVRVVGCRWGLPTMYPNIVNVTRKGGE